MEVELNFIEELLDGLAEKIKCVEGKEDCQTVYDSLKSELDKLYLKYEKLIDMYEDDRIFCDYHMKRLKTLEKDCRFLQNEMATLLPSWRLPEEPILSEEDEKEFIPFAEWLHGYMGYLVCLMNIRKEEMTSKFSNRLYGLRRDLGDIVKLNRFKLLRGDLFTSSSELREMIHQFDDKSTDVLERYLKGGPLADLLVLV